MTRFRIWKKEVNYFDTKICIWVITLLFQHQTLYFFASISCMYIIVYLLTVEDDHEFQSVHEWQQRAKQSPSPHHRLSVHQSQDIGRDQKLLTAYELNQLIGRAVNHHPGTREPRTHQIECCMKPSLLLTLSSFLTFYLRGNSTSTSIARVMSRSNRVSLYISCPTRVSQHYIRISLLSHFIQSDTIRVQNNTNN